MTALSTLSLDDLTMFVKNLKAGIMEAVDMGPAAFVSPGKKECPPVAGFQMSLGFLQTFEQEIRSRGIDPSGPEFGPDLLGMFAPLMAEVMAETAA